jgi:pyrrolidone-carboxylate peptidase
VVLPVIRGEAEDAALRALRAMADDDNRPGFMISLGEAPCAEVRLEKVAINWDDFRIPDNAATSRATRRSTPADRTPTS